MSYEAIKNAHIEWREDGLPWSPQFEDVYFSRGDPCAETEHVFLEGNQLPARFPRCAARPFVIAELGFGSGLNFLCAWRLWNQLAPTGATLHFVSCEQFPLRREDLLRFHALWPPLQDLASALQTQYPEHGAGLHRLHLGSADRPVILDLMYGEASRMYEKLGETARQPVDAWFLDGFAPRINPEMWADSLFSAMARLSTADTSVATYSVAAPVRQGLTGAGFAFSKQAGYGNKRHMLCARYVGNTISTSITTATQAPGRIAIIGAGLAGSACAFALARRGRPVDLFERASGPASGASGNPQGALFLPLHRDANQRAALLRQAAMYAFRHYNLLTQMGADMAWHPDGALQLNEKNGPGFFAAVCSNPLYAPALARKVAEEEAEALAGTTLGQEALFLQEAGWLSPQRLCHYYLSQPGINVHYDHTVDSLHQTPQGWRLRFDDDHASPDYQQVIVASSVDAPALLQKQQYPLFPNRGQLSYLRPSQRSSELQTALCGKGYLLPAHEGRHCVGSSFHPRNRDTTLSAEDHQHNLQLLAQLSPELAASFSAESLCGGRASLRCTTSDYLPLAGAVEDVEETLRRCAALTAAQRTEENFAVVEKGLYLCAGLGSHGITTSPLLAELLASEICASNPPLFTEDVQQLQPLRFLLRRLRQNNYTAL